MTTDAATELQTTNDFLEHAWRNCRAVDADYRWTAEDMTPALIKGAWAYALAYRGTFEFMADMRAKATRGFLSANQAKGVLNCMMADVRRERQAATAVTVDMSALMTLFQRAGTHLRNPRITLGLERPVQGSTSITLKLMTRGQHPGSINLGSGSWPNGIWYGRIEADGRLTRGRAMTDDVMGLITELAADPVAAARRYASLTGQCCFCNLRLTTDESVAAGYGPVCAEHYGLPWGARSELDQAVIAVQRQARRSVARTNAGMPRRVTPQVPALDGMTPLGMQAEAIINNAVDGINAAVAEATGAEVRIVYAGDHVVRQCSDCPAFSICQTANRCEGGVSA